jgi:hypothetical protein
MPATVRRGRRAPRRPGHPHAAGPGVTDVAARLGHRRTASSVLVEPRRTRGEGARGQVPRDVVRARLRRAMSGARPARPTTRQDPRDGLEDPSGSCFPPPRGHANAGSGISRLGSQGRWASVGGVGGGVAVQSLGRDAGPASASRERGEPGRSRRPPALRAEERGHRRLMPGRAHRHLLVRELVAVPEAWLAAPAVVGVPAGRGERRCSHEHPQRSLAPETEPGRRTWSRQVVSPLTSRAHQARQGG